MSAAPPIDPSEAPQPSLGKRPGKGWDAVRERMKGTGPAVACFYGWEKSYPKPLTGRDGVEMESSYVEKPLSNALAPGNRRWLIAPYATPARRRLGRDPIGAGTSLVMHLLLVRIVDPEGERDDYKHVVKARDEWLSEVGPKLERVLADLRPVGWSDPAGITFAWILPEPFAISTAEDAKRWGEWYFAVRKYFSKTYQVTPVDDGSGFDALFPAPTGELEGDPREVPTFTAVPFPPPCSERESTKSKKKRGGGTKAARGKPVDYTAITRAAYDRGIADGDRAVNILADASDDMPDLVSWTTYDGDRHKTHGGDHQERTFQAFGDSLVSYSKRVAPKGARWFMGATSTNGRCRDEDIEAIHLPSLDCDGKGDWTKFLEVLNEAGLGYVAQRSARHTPEVPKWHASLAFAHPWTGEKRRWRPIWRWLIGYFAAVADLQMDWDRTTADPETGELRPAPLFGFDHMTDRLGQPIFPAARRDSTCEPPETVVTAGKALDLEKFLLSTGFDPAWLDAADAYEPADAPSIDPARGLIALAFAECGMLGPRIGSKGYAAECPNEHEHSPGGSRFDSSTIIFDPGQGQAIGFFKCSHDHCSHLAGDVVLKMIDRDAVARARKVWNDAVRGRGAREDDGRPVIRLGIELHDSVNLAVAALKSDPDMFQRGGRLVDVIPITHEESEQSIDANGLPTLVEGSPTIRDLPRSIVNMRLSKHARFERFTGEDEWEQCRPEKDLVDMVHDLGRYLGIPPLVQIIEAPVLLHDLSVLQKPGYHAATGAYFVSSREFPKALEHPTLEDAQAALARLRYPFLDFPFANEEARLGPIAAAMTITCRLAINGHIPGFMFDASTPGSGKSLLTDAISMIVSGHECPRMSYPVHFRRQETDEPEMGKILAGYADAGTPYFSFDNVPVGIAIGGGSLDKALTQRNADFRRLGSTGNPRRRWRTAIMITANNPMFHDDGAARRWLQSRLEPQEEPDKRDPETFREKNLIGYLEKNHPQLAMDLLTIPRAYLFAVRADLSQRRKIAHWPSFERWTEIVPAALAWVSGIDVTAARVSATASPKTGHLSVFLEIWEELLGTEPLYAKDALAAIYAGKGVQFLPYGQREPAAPGQKRFLEMVEALHGLCKPAQGVSVLDADRFAKSVLRPYKGRPAGDPARRLVGTPDRKDVMLWTVVRAGAAARTASARGAVGDPCDV